MRGHKARERRGVRVIYTPTQFAAALAALGHYEGMNSDTEHAREAARLGGESYYRLLLVNALLGVFA